MSDSNCVTLFKELCESFLASSGVRVSHTALNSLTKKALSTVFSFHGDNDSPSNDAYFMIKTNIISNSLAKELNKTSIAQIDQCLHDLERLFTEEHEKESLYSLLLFLYKLSCSSCKDSSTCELISNGHDADIVNANFTGANWDIFYHDPCDNTPTFSYPFYEKPGTDIKFINDYCPIIEPFIDKLFQRNNKIWRFGEDINDNTIAQDEGFVTPGSQFSKENQEEIDDSDSDNSSSYSDYLINDNQCLKLDKRTWEQLGSFTYHPEKPFASEVLETVIHFWKILNACENPKKRTFSVDPRLLVTFDELKSDIQYLLFGMESYSFFYNRITKVFYMRDKIHLKTVTPELLNDFCKPAIDCASYYYSLKTFVEQRSNLPFGPVHKIFCRSLYQILNVYKYTLLNINWENISYMSQFEPLLTPLRRKLRFLVKFCLISIGDESNGLNFPASVQLLDYLYNSMTRVFRSDFGFLLFHVFESCCNMYLKVVSEWIFDGCFSNPANYEEFFIDIQREDEICRDWKRVSCIKVKEKRVPKILEDFYKNIFVCGKSVNLLKIFTTREVLESLLQKNHPNLKCCFNKNQLDEYTKVWQEFQSVNTKNFCSKERIKNKLTKSYGPEFYIHIKKVREDWFMRHQSNIKHAADTITSVIDVKCEESVREPKHHSVVHTEESTVNSVVLTTDAQHEKSEGVLKNNSVVENENPAVSAELQNFEKNVEQSVSPLTKTKKLVQFFDSLSSPSKESHEKTQGSVRNPLKKISVQETRKECNIKDEDKTARSDSETLLNIKDKSSQVVKNMSNRTNSVLKDESRIAPPTELNGELNSSRATENLISTRVTELPVSDSQIRFGDYKCDGDQASKIQIIKMDAKPAAATSSPLSFGHMGCGDFAAPEMLTLNSKNSLGTSASGEALAGVKESFDLSIVEEPILETSNQLTHLNDTISELQNKTKNPSVCAHDRNRLKAMSSDYQKQLSEMDNEVTNLESSNIKIQLDNTVCKLQNKNKNTPLSSHDRNRLKNMSSDHQKQLSEIDSEISNLASSDLKIPLDDTVCEQQNKHKSTFLSAHDRNRLKIMSSDHQKQLSQIDCEVMETVSAKTPMTIRDINKRRVMSSEYHLRLSSTEKPKDIADSVEQLKKRELTECERNKLKVMSSEYHVRLQESLNPGNESVESDSTPIQLSERDMNKLKVMSSEYHCRLTACPVVEKAHLLQSIKTSEESSTEFEKSVRPIENVRETNEELETISEDVDSEDPVTVVENNEYCQPSLPADNEKREKRPSSLLFLENYITYGDQSFACFSKEAFDDLKAAADSVCEVDRSSVLYYLSQSIVIPLRIQARIVNEAVLHVFIEEEGYLNHLTTLRNYMFLRKPEFSLLLTNTVFRMAEKVKKPHLLLNNYTLSCILQQALLAANSRESIVFERKLSLCAEGTIPEIFDLTDIKALNCVSLSYSVKWPINVLITEPISKKYTRIFKFLMQIQRASWVLKNDFKNLKNLKQGKSMQYVQIQLYRYTMMQVVRMIQEFVVREALERCWNELVDYLTNSEISLDDLYMSHLRYVNKIMQRCFLCDLSFACHQSISNLLSSVLKYHVCLRSGKWQRNEQVNFLYHTNFKNIHIVYEEFKKCLDDVRAKLKLLVYKKQRRYFEPLLLELCKNTIESSETHGSV